MPVLWAIFAVFLGVVTLATAAQAENRVALVIGNAAYVNTAPLANPGNDVGDIAAALRRLNFQVIEGRDLDKRSMERTIRQFAVGLTGADVALFYYAGHGLQIGGQNYLVPTDAKLSGEGDLDFESVPLSLVVKQMEREAKTSLVLLDACRDNPLGRNLARSMGTRAAQIGQGLAEVRTGVGTLIGFSTQPGSVSLDGTGRNSPYAAALLDHIEVPGKDVSAVLVSVRNDVLKATAGRQVPWEHTSLTGQVFLRPAPRLAAGSGKDYDKQMEIAYWNSVRDAKSAAAFQAYLERYPRGTFAGLARTMIADLAQKPNAPTQANATIASQGAGSRAKGRPGRRRSPHAGTSPAQRAGAGRLHGRRRRRPLGRSVQTGPGGVLAPCQGQPSRGCADGSGTGSRPGSQGTRVPAQMRQGRNRGRWRVRSQGAREAPAVAGESRRRLRGETEVVLEH